MNEFIRLSDIELSKLRGKVAINRYAKSLLDSPIFSDLRLDGKELIYNSHSLSETLNDKEREILSHYSGFGGKLSDLEKGHGGEIYEFYTPDYLCKLMWDIAIYYGFDGKGNVLEPSCGNGNLIKYAPDKSKVTAFEINTDSARIAKLLYNATIYPYEFERAFLEGNMWNKPIKQKATWLPQYPFSLIIGNPPYGVHTGYYKAFFQKNYKRVEFFFIQKGLELLQNEGLMVFLVPSLFMMNGDKYQGTKQEIAQVADLVDAYRVGSVFDNSKVMADVLVFRKTKTPAYENTLDLLTDDNFFKKYPQKLAGVYEATTSMHFPIIMKVTQEQVEKIVNEGIMRTNEKFVKDLLGDDKQPYMLLPEQYKAIYPDERESKHYAWVRTALNGKLYQKAIEQGRMTAKDAKEIIKATHESLIIPAEILLMLEQEQIVHKNMEHIRVNHNEKQKGIEVSFRERPSDDSISWLKNNGFRWSSRNKLWYKSFSQEAFNEALNYFSNDIDSTREYEKNKVNQRSSIITNYAKAFSEQIAHENAEININKEEIEKEFRANIAFFISYIDGKMYKEILSHIEPKQNYLYRSIFEEYTGMSLGDTSRSWLKVLSDFVKGKAKPTLNTNDILPKKIKMQMSERLLKFMPKSQQYALAEYDTDSYNEIVANMNERADDVPKLYHYEKAYNKAKRENKTAQVISSDNIYTANLHYFNSSSDWYICEYSEEDDLFYGFAILNGDLVNAKYGYISREELTADYGFGRSSQLDFYFMPRTIRTAKQENNIEDTPQQLPTEVKEVKKIHVDINWNIHTLMWNLCPNLDEMEAFDWHVLRNVYFPIKNDSSTEEYEHFKYSFKVAFNEDYETANYFLHRRNYESSDIEPLEEKEGDYCKMRNKRETIIACYLKMRAVFERHIWEKILEYRSKIAKSETKAENTSHLHLVRVRLKLAKAKLALALMKNGN